MFNLNDNIEFASGWPWQNVVVVNHSNIIQSLTLPPPPRGQTLLPVDPVMLVVVVLVVLVVADLELGRWLLC